jgi:hypothetical protein
MGVPPGFRGETAQAQPGAAAEQQAGGRGGSFLGTAAAAAAGVIGGALLLDGIKSMMGQGKSGLSALDAPGANEQRSPWGLNSSDNDLARQAGVGDIGRDRTATAEDPNATTGYGLFEDSDAEAVDDQFDADDGFDIGGDADII